MYFLDVDEDGELITVQKDEDLTGFTDSYIDPDKPLHVHLGELLFTLSIYCCGLSSIDEDRNRQRRG